MASQEELGRIRRFVCDELGGEPDLSTLTIGILKRRYLARLRRHSLSPEAKHFMKQVVLVELRKMQDNENIISEPETKERQNKRKREKGNDEVMSGDDESTAKKSRCQPSSDLDDEDDCNTRSEESEEEEEAKSGSDYEEQEANKSQGVTTGATADNSKHQMNSEDSTGEQLSEPENDEEGSDCGSSPEGMVNTGASTTKGGETGSSNKCEGKKKTQSDDGDDGDQLNDNNSSCDSYSETKDKVSVEKRLPLDDEEDSETKTRNDDKKKNAGGKKSTGGQRGDKAVVRLKRYIALCGVRRNYKKLLDGCRSARAEVAVLKKELEDLGIHGHPTIQKCKRVRAKREEDREIAELDVNNIIVTEGRPRRRTAWQKQLEPSSPRSISTLNSNSDSDEENITRRGRRGAANWANLNGIVSDDSN